ncbi:DnaD domain protein [Dehalobacterium formicoaceticum]|uniref:DnaD domain protein n=1 Tax=Dehalobacterium formicoaceticum TaxID=51515 RepID=UPI000B7DBB2A|nr:DnaD domain protein [Dehalobacterium formicoaceticum]
MIENKWEKRCFFSVHAESTHVPNLILKNYRDLDLTEKELVFIIQLIMIGNYGTLSVKEIARTLNMGEAVVKQNLASLMEKSLIVVENVQISGQMVPRYFLDGLYDRMVDIWALEMAKKNQTQDQDLRSPDQAQKFKVVLSSIEKEFGRPLTPIENDKIMEWLEQLGFDADLVLEALKRTVLRGVYNLNYIDRILLEWKKSNIRTVHEVIAFENHKMNKNKKAVKKTIYPKKSMKNFDDLYEL